MQQLLSLLIEYILVCLKSPAQEETRLLNLSLLGIHLELVALELLDRIAPYYLSL
jgi:hypothetical protein